MNNQVIQYVSGEMTVRALAFDDLDALMNLQSDGLARDPIARRNLRHLLRAPTAVCVGTFAGLQLVGAGIMLFRSRSSIASLYLLVTHPDLRRYGVASRLVDELMIKARAQACCCVRLEVRMDNVAAQSFYKNRGFDEVGMIPDYYNDRACASMLELILD